MKMAASQRTKTCRRRAIIFSILHILCLVGPFLYFIPLAYITGAIVSKVALSFSIVISLMLGALSFIVGVKNKAGLHRSMLWIVISGVLACLSAVKPFIWIMAGVSLLDELVITKIRDHYKAAKIANKEIDLRTEVK